MAKNEASIGAGNVDIVLVGETRTLKTSFRAAQNLSRQFGGFSDIINRLMKLDLDVIQSVVVNGLNLTEKGQEGIGEKIYASNPAKFVGPCIKFVTNLANGGVPPEEKAEEDEAPNGDS